MTFTSKNATASNRGLQRDHWVQVADDIEEKLDED